MAFSIVLINIDDRKEVSTRICNAIPRAGEVISLMRTGKTAESFVVMGALYEAPKIDDRSNAIPGVILYGRVVTTAEWLAKLQTQPTP